MLLTHGRIVKFNNHAKEIDLRTIVLNVIEMFAINVFQKWRLCVKNVFHDFIDDKHFI